MYRRSVLYARAIHNAPDGTRTAAAVKLASAEKHMKLFPECGSRFLGQISRLDEVESGFGSAANFSRSLSKITLPSDFAVKHD